MPTNTRASVLSFLLQLLIWLSLYYCWASLVAQTVKNPLQCRRPGFNPWVGEIPWRKAWQHTPVFLPGEFHGQRKFFLYWFFVFFLNSTMFGEYWSSVLGLILFFLLISTLYSLSLWMISASTLIATYQLLTQIFISSQYPSPALQLLIFNLLFGIHFDV